MELKEHAASCKGVEKLFEKEENSRLGKLRSSVQGRTDVAAKERQHLVTECVFFKHRLREVNIYNSFNEVLTRYVRTLDIAMKKLNLNTVFILGPSYMMT